MLIQVVNLWCKWRRYSRQLLAARPRWSPPRARAAAHASYETTLHTHTDLCIFCKTTHIDTTNENPWCVCILSNCCSSFFIIKYNYVLSVMYGGFVHKIKYCIIEYSIYLRRKSWSYYGNFGKNIALKIKYAFKPIVLRCWNKLK